jgi:formate dehydrogenase major subunit
MINADVVLVMGGNPAEDHPIAMNWLTRTKERGAYILHVTRASTARARSRTSTPSSARARTSRSWAA